MACALLTEPSSDSSFVLGIESWFVALTDLVLTVKTILSQTHSDSPASSTKHLDSRLALPPFLSADLSWNLKSQPRIRNYANVSEP